MWAASLRDLCTLAVSGGFCDYKVSLSPAVNEMLNENKQLEQGMKEILQAIQDTQKKTPTSTGVSIPSLERLVNVRSPTVGLAHTKSV